MTNPMDGSRDSLIGQERVLTNIMFCYDNFRFLVQRGENGEPADRNGFVPRWKSDQLKEVNQKNLPTFLQNIPFRRARSQAYNHPTRIIRRWTLGTEVEEGYMVLSQL